MKSLLAAPRALRTLAQGAHFRRARRSDAGLLAGVEKDEEKEEKEDSKNFFLSRTTRTKIWTFFHELYRSGRMDQQLWRCRECGVWVFDSSWCSLASTSQRHFRVGLCSFPGLWGEGGHIYLDMSKHTCGVVFDATVPEVALDMSWRRADDCEEFAVAVFSTPPSFSLSWRRGISPFRDFPVAMRSLNSSHVVGAVSDVRGVCGLLPSAGLVSSILLSSLFGRSKGPNPLRCVDTAPCWYEDRSCEASGDDDVCMLSALTACETDLHGNVSFDSGDLVCFSCYGYCSLPFP